jgi:hypothetical protein
MNEDRSTVPFRLLGPRSTLDDLSNVIVDPLPNGSLCVVLSRKSIYYLDKESLIPVLSPNIVATGRGSDAPGRWVEYQDFEGGVCGPLVNGAFREILPTGDIFPTQSIWWDSPAKNYKLTQTIYTRDSSNLATQIQTTIYSGGVPVQVITDVYTYSGQVVSTVTRSVV